MPQSRRSSTRTSRSLSDRRKSLNPNRVPWNPSNANNGRQSVSKNYSPRLSQGEKYREQKSVASARDPRSGRFSNHEFQQSCQYEGFDSKPLKTLPRASYNHWRISCLWRMGSNEIHSCDYHCDLIYMGSYCCSVACLSEFSMFIRNISQFIFKWYESNNGRSDSARFIFEPIVLYHLRNNKILQYTSQHW